MSHVFAESGDLTKRLNQTKALNKNVRLQGLWFTRHVDHPAPGKGTHA
jgi:hypothetical protein